MTPKERKEIHQLTKIALVLVGYKETGLMSCLAPWLDLKYGVTNENTGIQVSAPAKDLQIEIALCSALFKERWDAGETYQNDMMARQARELERQGILTFIEIKNPILDYESRKACWHYLRGTYPDLIWELDADEFYSREEIERAVAWIRENPYYDFYRINFKNYFGIGRELKYVKNFSPVRIINNRRNGGVNNFYFDNDIVFQNNIRTPNCAGITIPKVNPRHFSWVFQTAEEAQKKINYQLAAIKTSSYEIENGKLVHSKKYYSSLGEPMPEIFD